jgi:hypothetical protein
MSRSIRKLRLLRGAALPEAGIVAPIFALIWLVSVAVGGTYEAKMRSVNQSRSDGFYYASHNCEQTAGNSTTSKSASSEGDFNNVDGATDGDGETAASGDKPAQFASSLFLTTVKSEAKFNYPFANNPTSYGSVKTVHSETTLMCNEGPYGANIFKYLGGLLSGARSKGAP